MDDGTDTDQAEKRDECAEASQLAQNIVNWHRTEHGR